MITDLADDAEVLQPRLNGMKASQLCRLIEAYAAKRRRSIEILPRPSRHRHAGQRRTRGPSRITGRERIWSAFPSSPVPRSRHHRRMTEVHCRQDRAIAHQHDAYPPSDRAFERRIAIIFSLRLTAEGFSYRSRRRSSRFSPERSRISAADEPPPEPTPVPATRS